jgi:hypothetical protein
MKSLYDAVDVIGVSGAGPGKDRSLQANGGAAGQGRGLQASGDAAGQGRGLQELALHSPRTPSPRSP